MERLEFKGRHFQLAGILAVSGEHSAFRTQLARQVDAILQMEHLKMIDPEGFARAKALSTTTTMSFWEAYEHQRADLLRQQSASATAAVTHTAPA